MRAIYFKGFIFWMLIFVLACAPTQVQDLSVVPETTQSESVALLLRLQGFKEPTEALEQNKVVQLWDGSVLIEPSDLQASALSYQNLARDVSYELNIALPNYLPLKKFLYFDSKTPEQVLIQVTLTPVGEYFSGHIKDSEGVPIARALVRCGEYLSESDLSGHFSLSLPKQTLSNCTLYRQGYSVLKSDLRQQQDYILVADNRVPRLVLADQFGPLGLDARDWKQSIQSLLHDTEKKSWQIALWSEQKLNPGRDLLWLASPKLKLSKIEQTQILDFVSAGGKLLVTGEWAGFGGFEPVSLERLFSSLGVELGQDTLSQEAQSLEIRAFRKHYLSEKISLIKLFRSASVHVFDPQKSTLLAWAPTANYRIFSHISSAVFAAGHYGLGRFVVLGDTSLWLEQQEDGLSHYQSADNALLWQHILDW